MSFSSEIKKELCSNKDMTPNEMKAMLYGILFATRYSEDGRPVIQTENTDLISALRMLTAGSFPSAKAETKRLVTNGGSLFSFRIKSGYDDMSAEFGDYSSIAPIIAAQGDDVAGAFLRGIFVACGSVTDPHKEYHLELVLPFGNRAEAVCAFAAEHGINLKTSVRSRNTGSLVLYAKGSELIEDFLTYIGAANHSLEIMRVKVEKDFRNRVNRHVNCESANLDKTVNAAQRIIEDIELIYSKGVEKQLSADLQQTARLRISNPEMSLSELCQQFPIPISRSGLNHRLKKLAKIAEELRNSEADVTT
ncbi:MAG: DNA-binding protein WhiA [Ruminococcus sp.]|nr:DNA-binding protein WhiA [Ruminococcus sp.]